MFFLGAPSGHVNEENFHATTGPGVPSVTFSRCSIRGILDLEGPGWLAGFIANDGDFVTIFLGGMVILP